jgi:hypothetical protein
MKYSKYEKWFIARCYLSGLSYEEFAPLAERVLGISVPQGTYGMQRAYLRKLGPEEIAEKPTTSVARIPADPPPRTMRL